MASILASRSCSFLMESGLCLTNKARFDFFILNASLLGDGETANFSQFHPFPGARFHPPKSKLFAPLRS
jgi:hypothetical protein